METSDVIVAGGGIIGLSVAMELARNGLGVRLLEKGRPMREASWAAAGMLAANDPENPPALAALASLSAALYPDYLRTVEELSGRRVPLRTRGTLLSSSPPNGHAIDAAEAARRIPGLALEGRNFSWIEEVSLDPRDLCSALPAAAAAAGVDIQQETAVLAVTRGDGSLAVTTAAATFQTSHFVNCCGAWAAQVRYAGLATQPAAGVEPRKGQMIAVQLPAPLDLPCVVRTPEIYLVPRGGGQVVIGATVERVGFDRRLDPEASARLSGLAAAIWPPIASATVTDTWSGLRPGSPDELPLLGRAGIPQCWLATGHFRNGILLAPATALLLRQLLVGAPPAIDLSAFAPGR